MISTERTSRALHGALYEQVLPLIDGKRSANQIVAELAGKADAARVYFALMQLEKRGHIREASLEVQPEVAAIWDDLGGEPAKCEAALRATRLVLHQSGKPRGLEGLLAALCAAGFVLAELGAELDAAMPQEIDPSALHVVLADDYLSPSLLAFNRLARQSGARWLPLRLQGAEAWFGPVYEPRSAACHHCLARRLTRNRALEAFLRTVDAQQLAGKAPARAAHPASLGFGANWAAHELAKLIGLGSSRFSDRMLSMDYGLGGVQEHRLVADPLCPDSGSPGAIDDPKIELQARQAMFTADGGHRVISADATIERYKHHVSPITGVVRFLTDISKPGSLANVFVAGHNPVLRPKKLAELKKGLRSSSAGKGVSLAQAKASALCEALERYSGEWQGEAAAVTASWTQMQAQYGDAAIHPNAVMRYSEAQFAKREEINAKNSHFNKVPLSLADDTEIDWTAVWSLRDQQLRYLPTQLVYYQAPARAQRGEAEADKNFYCFGCSNGNAAGNTLEEAVLQGFFELIERDSVALWWYPRARRAGIDLDSANDSHLNALVAEYKSKGRECWALDITSDLGIPTAVAISRKIDAPAEAILFGLGCHFDARIALQRAFAEMNQMAAFDDVDPETGKHMIEDEETLQWLEHACLARDPYLAADPAQKPRDIREWANLSSGNLLRDIQRCKDMMAERGMDMLVLNQTRSDIGVATVKVIVPGLRHFWARFAPGRLYDVPLKQGWISKPLLESDMNPIPVFM